MTEDQLAEIMARSAAGTMTLDDQILVLLQALVILDNRVTALEAARISTGFTRVAATGADPAILEISRQLANQIRATAP